MSKQKLPSKSSEKQCNEIWRVIKGQDANNRKINETLPPHQRPSTNSSLSILRKKSFISAHTQIYPFINFFSSYPWYLPFRSFLQTLVLLAFGADLALINHYKLENAQVYPFNFENFGDWCKQTEVFLKLKSWWLGDWIAASF